MTSLPFLQAPAEPRKRICGTPATGTLEFPVLGGLTVGETQTITELLAGEASVFTLAAQAADAISKAEDISISEAFDIIENAIRGSDMEAPARDISARHAAQIESISRAYASSGQRNMAATVTALIRHRLNLPSWGMADTGALLQPLFDDIWNLAEFEQSAEPAVPSEPPTDEKLGKPPEESGSRPKRTGPRSRGT